MILGLGVDMVRIKRMDKLSDHQRERMFSPSELKEAESVHLKSEYFASRFAAKEAFSKAIGTGLRGFSLTDISVLKDSMGKPELVFTGDALAITENKRFLLSITHEGEYAVAVVVCDEK